MYHQSSSQHVWRSHSKKTATFGILSKPAQPQRLNAHPSPHLMLGQSQLLTAYFSVVWPFFVWFVQFWWYLFKKVLTLALFYGLIVMEVKFKKSWFALKKSIYYTRLAWSLDWWQGGLQRWCRGSRRGGAGRDWWWAGRRLEAEGRSTTPTWVAIISMLQLQHWSDIHRFKQYNLPSSPDQHISAEVDNGKGSWDEHMGDTVDEKIFCKSWEKNSEDIKFHVLKQFQGSWENLGGYLGSEVGRLGAKLTQRRRPVIVVPSPGGSQEYCYWNE